jgi:hypothetical protein
MAHFAELDSNNVVVQTIVVANEDMLDANGQESEAVGVAFCQSLFGQETRWVQTSYNNSFRKQYAGFGHRYDEALDVFIAPQPFESWALDENLDWQAPVPAPKGAHTWDEETLSWLDVGQPQ